MNIMQQFEITLINEKVRSYYRISWIIIIIHIIVLLYLGLFSTDRRTGAGSIATLIILAGCLIARFYLKKKRKKLKPDVDIFFFVLMIGWISNGQYWLTIIPAIFYILSAMTLRKFIASFSTEKIMYPSVPVKTILWQDLNIAILKDGLLTIDFKNNKVIQQSVDETKTSVNEQEFNDFCTRQLAFVASQKS
jgi:hypothetical protein